jgi:hypothetical protein
MYSTPYNDEELLLDNVWDSHMRTDIQLLVYDTRFVIHMGYSCLYDEKWESKA